MLPRLHVAPEMSQFHGEPRTVPPPEREPPLSQVVPPNRLQLIPGGGSINSVVFLHAASFSLARIGLT